MEREEEEEIETIDKEFRPDPNDDRPLCKGASTFTISEYADGECPPGEDSTTPAASSKRFVKPTTKQHPKNLKESNYLMQILMGD